MGEIADNHNANDFKLKLGLNFLIANRAVFNNAEKIGYDEDHTASHVHNVRPVWKHDWSAATNTCCNICNLGTK